MADTPNKCLDMKQKLLSISANALRSCLGHVEFDTSFDDLQKINKKCTTKQIIFYQMFLKLHKLLNEHENSLSFEHVTLLDQILCIGRQIKFQILRNFNSKIGLNTTVNKLYPLSNLFGLDMLNTTVVHLKKLEKFQF